MMITRFNKQTLNSFLRKVMNENLKKDKKDFILNNRWIIRAYLENHQIDVGVNFLRDSIFGSQYYELSEDGSKIFLQSCDGEKMYLHVMKR